MRLLITRPEPDASLSAERLRALGHEVLVEPVLETVFSNKPLGDVDDASLVVTSRNGVRALISLSTREMRETALLYAVGDATAKLALDAGFKKVKSASGDVEQLVALIGSPSLERLNRLIYVCGRDRKGQLENKLEASGWKVDVCERYHTDIVEALSADALNAISEKQIDAVLLYSGRTAEAFKQLVSGANISQITNLFVFFCLAKSIKSVFDEQSMFDALALYQSSG